MVVRKLSLLVCPVTGAILNISEYVWKSGIKSRNIGAHLEIMFHILKYSQMCGQENELARRQQRAKLVSDFF